MVAGARIKAADMDVRGLYNYILDMAKDKSRTAVFEISPEQDTHVQKTLRSTYDETSAAQHTIMEALNNIEEEWLAKESLAREKVTQLELAKGMTAKGTLAKVPKKDIKKRQHEWRWLGQSHIPWNQVEYRREASVEPRLA